MAPHVRISLTPAGYRRCAELLAAAGMTFIAGRRDRFCATPGGPESDVLSGELVTARGTFRCQLGACGERYSLLVNVAPAGGLEVLEDVERALAGHLLERGRE